MLFSREIDPSQEEVSNNPFPAFEKRQWNTPRQERIADMKREFLVYKALGSSVNTWPECGPGNILPHVVGESVVRGMAAIVLYG